MAEIDPNTALFYLGGLESRNDKIHALVSAVMFGLEGMRDKLMEEGDIAPWETEYQLVKILYEQVSNVEEFYALRDYIKPTKEAAA